MPCSSPLAAFRPLGTGGRPRIGEPAPGQQNVETFTLSCGACLSCRIAKQRDWAIRSVHETQTTGPGASWFLTLTYNDRHLPPDKSLSKDDLTKFLKRFRKNTGSRIRYLACGEYGDLRLRPHFHLILWGHKFHDRVPWKTTKRGDTLFRSRTLEQAWSCPDRNCCPTLLDGSRPPIGHAYMGNVTFDSAAYVAGYTTKKMTGGASFYHYLRLNADDEMVSVEPEFARMSRGRRADDQGGIGYRWFQKFQNDVFPKDYVHIQKRGKARKYPSPRYYSKLYEQSDPEAYQALKERRESARLSRSLEDTPELRRARDASLRGERALYGHADTDGDLDRLIRDRAKHLKPNGFDIESWSTIDQTTGELTPFTWSDQNGKTDPRDD